MYGPRRENTDDGTAEDVERPVDADEDAGNGVHRREREEPRSPLPVHIEHGHAEREEERCVAGRK